MIVGMLTNYPIVLAMGPPPPITIPMAVIFPGLVVAFAAFALWLGVRIFNRRERWAKRTAIAVLVGSPLLYVLSFGPAVWLSGRGFFFGTSMDGRRMFIDSFYTPILWTAADAPSWVRNAVQWWGSLGVPDDETVQMFLELDDRDEMIEFPETTE